MSLFPSLFQSYTTGTEKEPETRSTEPSLIYIPVSNAFLPPSPHATNVIIKINKVIPNSKVILFIINLLSSTGGISKECEMLTKIKLAETYDVFVVLQDY
jgi:hypothetical protein